MSKLIIATNNQGKVREIKSILSGVYDEVCSLKDEGIKADVVEDGDTFYANAKKKAEEISLMCGCDVLADDSGLCVDALNGAPGVYSARFAGEHADDEQNNALLLEKLKAVPAEKRGAEFVCSIVMARSGKEFLHTDGKVRGVIASAPQGGGGFGYDPLFYVPEYKMTFGELDADIKNNISHRANALAQLKELLSAK